MSRPTDDWIIYLLWEAAKLANHIDNMQVFRAGSGAEAACRELAREASKAATSLEATRSKRIKR